MSIQPGAPKVKPVGQTGNRTLACVGCLAAALLCILAGILILAFMIRKGNVPEVFKGLPAIQKCSENMLELRGALERYHTRNDKYPDTLDELLPDYLASDKPLHCPIDEHDGANSGYVYTKPSPDAPKDTVVIRCYRHKPMTGATMVLELTLKGEIIPKLQSKQAQTPKKEKK